MNKVSKWMVTAGLVGMLGVCGAWAGGAGTGGSICCDPPKEGAKATPAAKPSRLDTLKKLAGRWESADGDKDGKPDQVAEYKVSSAGSIVVETLFPGSSHEMITIYHMDGDDLLVTHYCAAGNQPRLKCEPMKDPNVFVFKFKDGTNLDPKVDGYMGALTVTIKDDDHAQWAWTYIEKGKAQPHATFDMTRVKETGAAK